MADSNTKDIYRSSNRRIQFIPLFIALFMGVFGVRLAWLQLVKGSEFRDAAIRFQERELVVLPTRGVIYARQGSQLVPLVVNEELSTLFADPSVIDNPQDVARSLAGITGGSSDDYAAELAREDTFYVVLDRFLDYSTTKQIEDLGIYGVGIDSVSYRSYPEGDLASDVIGFVNDLGDGQYGVEEGLQSLVGGQKGESSVITDVNGVPLTTSNDSIDIPAVAGSDIVLTLDRNIQNAAEQALRDQVEATDALGGSVVVMDPYTGAILAMADDQGYQPDSFRQLDSFDVARNEVVADPYETGSTMKIFTVAAGLEEGVITPESTYVDPGYSVVDGVRINNAGNEGTVTRSISQVIEKSVNSGVVHVLEELGGGSVNDQGRDILHDYFKNSFGFDGVTGIELAGETATFLPGVDEGGGVNVRYANMTFGQGMSVTMLQMVTAFSSIVNGGTRYQPTVLSSVGGVVHEPEVLATNVVSQKTTEGILDMTQLVVESGGGYSAKRAGYVIGGKTATAQVLEDDGSYSETREVGSFMGYVGGDRPELVIMVRVDEPQIDGYAGSVGAAPVFAEVSNYLIDYLQIPSVVEN